MKPNDFFSKTEWEETAPPPSDEDIRAFESSHGIRFPKEYQEFLVKVANGGTPISDLGFEVKSLNNIYSLAELYGIRDDYFSLEEHFRLELYDTQVPNLLIIGDDGLGSAIMLSTRQEDLGSVYFFEHEFLAETGESPRAIRLANSFTEFIQLLFLP